MLIHECESQMSNDQQLAVGQWWLSTDGSGRKLVINGRVENGAASDWDVTLLPSGFRVMKTTDSITGGYRLTPTPQPPSGS